MTRAALQSHNRDSGETAYLLATDKAKDKRAASPHKSILWTVWIPILLLQFCLWICLATLEGAVPIYLHKHLGFDTVRVTEINYAQQALSNLTPILGGFVADRYLGRFHTIVIACTMFTMGMIMITVASHPAIASQELLLLGLFGGAAIAQGGTAPCIVVFGADQFHPDIPAQQVEKDSLFNWFYWAINIGSFMSFALLSNLAVDGTMPLIPERMGFFAAFGTATLVFFVGSVVFITGYPRYRRLPLQGSALSILLTTASYFVSRSLLHMGLALGGTVSVLYGTVVLIVTCKSTDWVGDMYTSRYGSFHHSQVHDVRQVLRVLPYLSMLVIFWAIYSQMETNFILQGCQMDLRVSGDQQISSAMLTMLDSGVILVFIPLFDQCVYPRLRDMGVQQTMLQKMGAGLLFSMAAMLCADWVEVVCKQRPSLPGISSKCVDTSDGQAALPMAEMSIWWHTPQYVLIGISKILASITSYDLFYSEVPESMRSACQSLNLLTTTLGYIVAGAINSTFSFWVTSDLNEGGLEDIFWIMAALAGLSLAVFMHVAQGFLYLSEPDRSAEATAAA